MCKAKYLVVCSGLAGPVTKAHYNQQDKMPEVINSISPKESCSSHENILTLENIALLVKCEKATKL
jgi:hypothetical protein